MKIKWMNVCRWLLGLLGVSTAMTACDKMSMSDTPVEYGCPYMEYAIKGKVIDARTGAGVAGIGVMPQYDVSLTDTTGVDGSFEIHGVEFPKTDLRVTLTDTDLAKDGAYQPCDTVVSLKKIKDGNGHWFEGTYEAVDVRLCMQKQNAE